MPALSPVASLSATCRSPSISTFTATTRPLIANQLFSIPVRSELCVKCSADPGQLNTSEGVTACIALASAGGVEGSFFTAQRCSPWLSRHSHGDSKVTGGCDVPAAALQRNAIATIVNVPRVIAPRLYHFVIAMWRSKEAESRAYEKQIPSLCFLFSRSPTLRFRQRPKRNYRHRYR